MMNVMEGVINQSKLFGAVVVKYLELCEMCGMNVDIYYIYGYKQSQVCFIHFLLIHVSIIMIQL